MSELESMSNADDHAGSEWFFTAEKLQHVYDSVAEYRRLAGKAVLRQVAEGFLLPCDAEVLRRETVEGVSF
jgi:hypothetical protein